MHPVFSKICLMAMGIVLTGCACAFTRADADKTGKPLWPSCLAAYSIKSAACSKDMTDPQNCPGR